MAEQIYLNLDELENYKQDLFKRLDAAVDQFYSVDRLFKQMDDYLYDEGLLNEFYFSYASQSQKIDNLHGKLWTLTNNIVKIYHEASETIDKPFKKNMEQFAERLSLVDINRHSVKTSGISVQGESWQAGDSISAPSTAYATFTTKNSIDFTDLMHSSFTRKMKQQQYQAFLEMSGQLDFQVNYETFVNTLYRQTDFNYETGVEKVTNIISTGLVIVCVGGLVVMSGGALAGLAVPGWIGTTTMVAGGVMSAQNIGHAITGLDINGNPLSQKEREAYILSAGTDIAFMIAGFGLNKILKNTNKLKYVEDPLEIARKQQQEIITSVKNGETILETTKYKGNFGEVVMDNHMETVREATRISGNRVLTLDDIINRGIDGVYESASPPPKYIIAEAKYGTSRLNKTNDGLQMSDDWIAGSERLENAVGPERAKEIRKEMFLNPENVQKVLINVDENGKIVESTLDEFGKKMKN
ncbi:hypothetical protein [Listeria booriae]|uniref:hypothetical protein n=1 Tax=Listeria booriae TaxID=1552123 RepID=UPI0021AB9453|nr:hypothetical protein [Listeria booriae]